MYAVLVYSKEMRSGVSGNPVMTKAGERFWVVEEPEGWVEASSRKDDGESIPDDALTFRTFEAADEFAKCWKGHPWWCSPDGRYEIVKVEPKYRQVRCGYVRCAHQTTPKQE